MKGPYYEMALDNPNLDMHVLMPNCIVCDQEKITLQK